MKWFSKLILILIISFLFIIRVDAIEIHNYDATGEKELVGTTLAVYDLNGKEIIRWITKDHSSSINLPEGEYILKEIEVPFDYELQDKSINFKVLSNGLSSTPVIMNNELKELTVPTIGNIRTITIVVASLLLLTCVVLLLYDDYIKKEKNKA